MIWAIQCLYNFIWCLLLPFLLLRLWWRGRCEWGHRQHIAERLGFYPSHQDTQPCLWVHAVSVGETRAAQPLIQALLEAYPDYTLLLTHMTPTGRATGHMLFGSESRLIQRYLPYDIRWMCKRFLRHYTPRLCVLMETEVWPNLVQQCQRHHVPVALVNARLSLRSLQRGWFAHTFLRYIAQGITCIAAQTVQDAQRLRVFTDHDIHVTGNLKFDISLSQDKHSQGQQLRAHIGGRAVLCCASTREGEERLILEAFCAWQTKYPSLGDQVLLLIVPRHQQRFHEVAALVKAQGLTMVRRSMQILDTALLTPNTQVLLGDTLGDMTIYMMACDIAFIGGSFLPFGGQNLIEACVLHRPVLIGPFTFNFEKITEDAISAGAAVRIASAHVLFATWHALLQNPSQYQAMSQAAYEFARQHRGATARTMTLLNRLVHC